MNEEEFHAQVAFALASCQMVELELKLYISDALALTARCTSGKVPFRFSGSDYIDSSLERLIDVFRKLSLEEDLITRLRRFKDERNFLAHRSMTNYLDYDGESNMEWAEEYSERLENILNEASMLRAAIRFYGTDIRSLLYDETSASSNE